MSLIYLKDILKNEFKSYRLKNYIIYLKDIKEKIIDV